MKKVLLLTILVTLASCGKIEDVTKEVGKGVLNVTETGFKAIDDGLREASKGTNDVLKATSKAVADINEETKTVATKAKQNIDEALTNTRNELEKENHEAVHVLGKTAEKVGQIPRSIGNDLLGTKSDSDEKVTGLENDVQDLQRQINELRAEMRTSFADASQALDQAIQTLRNEDTALSQAIEADIQAIHSQIAVEVLNLENRIDQNEALDAATFFYTLGLIGNLMQDVQQLENLVNNLEVVCDSETVIFLPHFQYRNVVTACELE